MNRRGLFATLLAPWLARFFPKPVARVEAGTTAVWSPPAGVYTSAQMQEMFDVWYKRFSDHVARENVIFKKWQDEAVGQFLEEAEA